MNVLLTSTNVQWMIDAFSMNFICFFNEYSMNVNEFSINVQWIVNDLLTNYWWIMHFQCIFNNCPINFQWNFNVVSMDFQWVYIAPRSSSHSRLWHSTFQRQHRQNRMHLGFAFWEGACPVDASFPWKSQSRVKVRKK